MTAEIVNRYKLGPEILVSQDDECPMFKLLDGAPLKPLTRVDIDWLGSDNEPRKARFYVLGPGSPRLKMPIIGNVDASKYKQYFWPAKELPVDDSGEEDLVAYVDQGKRTVSVLGSTHPTVSKLTPGRMQKSERFSKTDKWWSNRRRGTTSKGGRGNRGKGSRIRRTGRRKRNPLRKVGERRVVEEVAVASREEGGRR